MKTNFEAGPMSVWKKAAPTLVLVLITLVIWAWGGAHRGWTQTTVPVESVDEVTGITSTTYVSKWVPGLDFLVVGLVASGVVGAGFHFLGKWRRRTAS